MKFMNMKRFGAAVMGGVMALSMASPAFATANVEITGAFEEREIAVMVTDSGEAQINPYGLPVEITKPDKSKVQISGEQITCPVMAIRNQSTTPLTVNVSSFAVKPKGELAIGTKDNNKTAAVKLQVAALDDPSLAVLTTATTIENTLIDKFASDATWSTVQAANEVNAPAAAANATTITPTKKQNVAAIRAAAPSTDAADAGKLKYSAKSIALFRLKGELAEDPQTGTSPNFVDNPWEATDGFTANIVFTFKPATPNGATLTAAESSGTVTATFTANSSGLSVEKYEWTSSNTATATVASADTGTTATNTVSDAAGASAGDTTTITVVATLSNGSKLTATATYTKS